MPPFNAIPQLPFLKPPQTPYPTSELQKVEEKANDEIHLDEELKNFSRS